MYTQTVLAQFKGIVDIAGFYTDDDGYDHVIVATGDGNLTEMYFTPEVQVRQQVLTRFIFVGVTHLAGFFAPNDKNRIVLVATNDGNIHEVFFNPSTGLGQDILTHFDGIVSIAGFYTPDDSYRHVIVATKDGNVREVFYHPSIGVHISNPPLANFNDIVSIAGFYTPDDSYRHVIVATKDGNVREVFYHPSIGVHISSPPLTNSAGIVRVAGYFIPGANDRRVLLAGADGNVRFLDYSPAKGVQPGPLLQHFNGLVTAVAYYAPHIVDTSQWSVLAVATTTDGNIHTVFWAPPPPPQPTLPSKIEYLKAGPDNGYVNLGQPATLSWNVINAHPDTQANLQGHIGLEGSGELVLNIPHVGLQGSQTVVPKDDTRYTLTISDSTGQNSLSVWVRVHAAQPPTGSVFYLKMTNPQSQVTPCFTIAVYAQDEATAKSIAEQTNGGYTALSIDASQFANACG